MKSFCNIHFQIIKYVFFISGDKATLHNNVKGVLYSQKGIQVLYSIFLSLFSYFPLYLCDMILRKHSYFRYICILIYSCLMPVLLHSQNVVKQISNADGLSNNSVNCFLEDSEHTLWVGTWDGLNAYNGRSFKTYSYNKKMQDLSVIM